MLNGLHITHDAAKGTIELTNRGSEMVAILHATIDRRFGTSLANRPEDLAEIHIYPGKTFTLFTPDSKIGNFISEAFQSAYDGGTLG